jgi:3' exoribonuclease, RNase T-like
MTKPFKPWAFPANAIHVALDLEAASKDSNAAIVQLAAVAQYGSHGTYDEFNRSISLLSNETSGRHISKETMEWWDTQDKELRKKVFGGTQHLRDALEDFNNWAIDISGGELDRVVLWGNGTEFDNVILQNAFEHFATWPFHYRNNHHMRTLMITIPSYLQEMYHRRFSAENPDNIQHDALHDARYQHFMIKNALTYYGLY